MLTPTGYLTTLFHTWYPSNIEHDTSLPTCHNYIRDAPDEHHELYFRDIIACGAFLFSNPDYQEHMDYEPEEVFEANSDGSPTNQVYAELSSGCIWNEAQVH